jgi:nucleotide-binding universal stress UspA family protein
MIRKILLCIDTSKYAKRNVEYASNLAKELNAELSILHVVERGVHAPYVATPEGSIDHHLYIKEAEKFLNNITKDIKTEGLKISTKVMSTYGSAAYTIVEYAKKEKFDLLTLGAMGTSEIKDLLLGSIAHAIARHAPCSVLIIK